jgi:predicted transcriptional regulator
VTTSSDSHRVDRAVYNLLVAEDHPWLLGELQSALGEPMSLVSASVARLHADGLVTHDQEIARASRAAVRADELSI